MAFFFSTPQTELQKSRETGQDLMSLTHAMTDIQDTLGGGMPPSQNGSADEYIPPQFRGPSGVPDKAMGDTSATIAALQAQLNSTQSILVSHKDRIKSLEHLLNEHEAIKDEVLEMRRSMEESKREIEELLLKEERQGRTSGASSDDEAETNDHDGEETGEAGQQHGSKESSGVEEEDIADGGVASAVTTVSKAREDEIIEQNNALAARLDALTAELDEALQLSRSLQNQHAESTSTVKILETRIQALEKDVATRVVDASGKAGRAAEDRWEAWRTNFEESWKKERESWDLERERLKGVVREWEEASRRSQEEEEERLMNERRQALEDGDSESDEDDESPWLNGDMSTASDPGPEYGPTLVPGGGSPLVRSSSASPRSTAKGQRKSRRESNSRLDPAIRALRAASGGDRFEEGSSNGRTTPRNASPSTAADNAVDALRIRSARVRRAGTITRKRNAPQSIDPTELADGAAASRRSYGSPGRLGKTSSSVTVKGLSGLTGLSTTAEQGKDGLADGPGSGNSETHSTSTESDETAHEEKRAHAGASAEKAVDVAEVRRGEGPPIKLGVVGQHVSTASSAW